MKINNILLFKITVCTFLLTAWNSFAQSTGVTRNRPDEPRAEYSASKAINFIESSVTQTGCT